MNRHSQCSYSSLFAWLLLLSGNIQGCEAGNDLARETALDGRAVIESEMLDVPAVPRLDDAGNLEKSRVDIDGVGLYVLQEGDGPPLVLVNGGPGNTLHSFLPHFSAAAAFSRVIYYDQRGTGTSDWKPGTAGYSTSQAVNDLDALRQALHIDNWFVLGHSYGGLIAQWYAIRYPERVLGIVLVNSSMSLSGVDLGERDYRSPLEHQRIGEIYSIDGRPVVPVHSEQVDLPTLGRMVYNAYVNGDWKRQYFLKPDRARMAQIARYEWVHDKDFNSKLRADGFSRDLRGAFATCPLPTLILEGAHDPTWGADKAHIVASEHPNATMVVFESSAHFPFVAEPGAFFDVLEDFINAPQSMSRDSIEDWRRTMTERYANF